MNKTSKHVKHTRDSCTSACQHTYIYMTNNTLMSQTCCRASPVFASLMSTSVARSTFKGNAEEVVDVLFEGVKVFEGVELSEEGGVEVLGYTCHAVR